MYGTNGADALRGTATADAIHGLWGDDSIEGVAGRDFLFGGNGNDTLDGGAGTDFIDGGGHFDLVLYSSNTTPVWADLRTGRVSFPGQRWEPETLVGIEAIDGGSGKDRFIGDGAANHFWGGQGGDTLIGNVGSDTLLGGGGADSLDGGKGPDSLVGSFGDDTMLGGLHDDIFSFGPIGTTDDDGKLALVDFGRDVIDGGAGTDTLAIDGPIVDTSEPIIDRSDFIYMREAPPVRANLGKGTLRLGDSDNRSTLISIENIETGSGADSINGSAGDNFISAGDGANVVYAGAGDDTIVGGRSILYYDSHTGDATPVELLNGGEGDDMIYGMGSVDLPASSNNEGVEYPGTDILAGGNGNDTLYGGAATQIMSGGTGSDVFVLTDEISYVHAMPWWVSTTITDFERGKDKIGFNLSEYTGSVNFRGEFRGELELGDLAYFRDGADTVVKLQIYEEMNGVEGPYIILTGHIGRLSATDFDLG